MLLKDYDDFVDIAKQYERDTDDINELLLIDALHTAALRKRRSQCPADLLDHLPGLFLACDCILVHITCMYLGLGHHINAVLQGYCAED